jgi:aspartyl-tRNA(Asn)/glutamyl-tRNA(Gln) amidotransferase subunit C
MAITRDVVVHVAKLACLELSDAEITRMTSDLDNILRHVEELSKVNTTQVAPTTHLAVEQLGFNADRAQPTLSTAEALAEAPRTHSNGFAVPAFVDES